MLFIQNILWVLNSFNCFKGGREYLMRANFSGVMGDIDKGRLAII
jgi:hypothetical protein